MTEDNEEMLIRRFCANSEAFEKGKALRDGYDVLSLDRTVSARSKRIYISGSVRDGQELFGPWMIYDQEAGDVTSYFCQCGNCGSRYGGMCAHCAALLCEYVTRYSSEWEDEDPAAVPGIEELLDALPESDRRRESGESRGKSGEAEEKNNRGAGRTRYLSLDDPYGAEAYEPEEIDSPPESITRRDRGEAGRPAGDGARSAQPAGTPLTDEDFQSFRDFDGTIGEWLESVSTQIRGMGDLFPDEPVIHRNTDERLRDLIRDYTAKKRLTEQTAGGVMDLEPTLEEEKRSYSWFLLDDDRPQIYLTFRICNDEGKSYLIKNMPAFAEALQKEKLYTHGKFISFVHSKSMFTERGWQYCELILDAIDRGRSSAYAKELPMYPDMLDRLMEMNLDREMEWRLEGEEIRTVTVRDQNPPIRVTVRQNDGEYSVVFENLHILKGEKYSYIRIDDICYRPNQEFLEDMKEWLKTLSETNVRTFEIAGEDMPAFCAAIVPIFQKYDLVEFEGFSPEKYMPKKPVFSFYIDEENGIAQAKCYVTYGKQTCNLLREYENSREYRDISRERGVRALAEAYFPEKDAAGEALCFQSEDDDRMFRLLTVGLSQLAAEGKVYVTDRIRAHRVISNPRAQVGIAVAGGLLELTVATEEFPREELAGVIESYRQKKKYHRLRDGSFLNIQDNAMTGIAELMDGMALTDRQISAEHVEVPKYWAAYLDQSLKQGGGQLRVERGRDYKAIIRQMNNIADSDYAVPESLAGVLRGYQKTGYRWMRVLTELGFGGILADDMGLGKTLQTITCLLARKQEGELKKPCLVVSPASLIYNWQREFERFAPEMTVQVIAGTSAERIRMIRGEDRADEREKTNSTETVGVEKEGTQTNGAGRKGTETNGADVWITSYDMLKRDIDEYREIAFDTEVIDESQNIKNQNTLAAKAVKQIRADTRFALTGTPIENRLSELWSCFDYLMPGILGTYGKFRKKYEIPIVQNQDSETLARLKRMVSPFILRRLKQDVLKELPDKLEQVVYAKMEGEQRKLYAAHAARLFDSIKGKSAENFEEDRIEILAEMTKLRQLCCDPSLIFEDYHGASCKMDTCVELVREAVAGKHKVLIFSQFTSVFPLLEERLRAEGIAWYELTGKTPKKERQRLAEAFNTDDVPVFLISLKAGGTGLNLTAATIVIHFDPWWNLAAQNQATDRAHRIGQENQVVVFKLIAQDTIEEKILNLQEKKGMLADQVLEGGQVSAGTLTREDFMEILNFAE